MSIRYQSYAYKLEMYWNNHSWSVLLLVNYPNYTRKVTLFWLKANLSVAMATKAQNKFLLSFSRFLYQNLHTDKVS